MRHSQFLLIAIGITLDAVSIAKPSDHRYSEPFVPLALRVPCDGIVQPEPLPTTVRRTVFHR